MPNEANVTAVRTARASEALERARSGHADGTWPFPDLYWCGGCGHANRELSYPELFVMLAWIGEASELTFRYGADDLLAFIFRALETYQRGAAPEGCEHCGPVLPEGVPHGVPDGGFHLYRLWSPERRLLYVGVSTRLRARLLVHYKRWGHLIADVTWEEHLDAQTMLDAETRAINDEDPALNKAKVGSA